MLNIMKILLSVILHLKCHIFMPFEYAYILHCKITCSVVIVN